MVFSHEFKGKKQVKILILKSNILKHIKLTYAPRLCPNFFRFSPRPANDVQKYFLF